MNLSEYLVSIAALVLLSEISALLLPNGKTRRAAEIVFSLIIIIALISPIIRLVGGDFDISFGGGEYALDENFLEYFLSGE